MRPARFLPIPTHPKPRKRYAFDYGVRGIHRDDIAALLEEERRVAELAQPDFLLQEDGFYILDEEGGRLLWD